MKEITKETMEAMKTLAELGMKVSKAKAVLSEMEQAKDDFINSRKKEVEKEIDNLLKQSKDILDEISSNNVATVSLFNTVKVFTDFLEEAYTTFNEEITEFKRYEDEYCNYVAKEDKKLLERKNELIKQGSELKTAEEKLQSWEKELEKIQTRINSRRLALAQATKDLK